MPIHAQYESMIHQQCSIYSSAYMQTYTRCVHYPTVSNDPYEYTYLLLFICVFIRRSIDVFIVYQ